MNIIFYGIYKIHSFILCRQFGHIQLFIFLNKNNFIFLTILSLQNILLILLVKGDFFVVLWFCWVLFSIFWLFNVFFSIFFSIIVLVPIFTATYQATCDNDHTNCQKYPILIHLNSQPNLLRSGQMKIIMLHLLMSIPIFTTIIRIHSP